MTVGDILVSINQASLETMLPLTAVQTSADIERGTTKKATASV